MNRVFVTSRESRRTAASMALIVVGCTVLFSPPWANAIEYRWIGPSLQRWHNAGNWDSDPGPNGPDGDDVDVRFDMNYGGNATISLIQAPVTVRNFTFDSAGTNYEITGLSLQLASGGSTIDTIVGQHQISSGLVGDELLTKTGIGSLTLSGNNSFFSGDTIVEEGTLALGNNAELLSPNLGVGTSPASAAIFDVSSFIANYEIGASQSLYGHGTARGDFTNNGLVAPGGTGEIGDLEIMGTYTQTADGVLEIEYSGVGTAGTDFDQLNVTGTGIAQPGGQLHLARIGSFMPTPDVDRFDFLVADVQVQPVPFDSIKLSNPAPNVAIELDYSLADRVRAKFVSLDRVSQLKSSGSWHVQSTWNSGAIPTTKTPVNLQNSKLPQVNGLVEVSGANAFAHTVSVSADTGRTITLQIDANRSLSATHGVELGPGGVLAGAGTIVGNVNNDGGTVSPGISPGSLIDVLSIDGEYHQGNGGLLAIDLDPANLLRNDLLSVTGDVTLDGTLEINLLGATPAVGESFVILESAGTISGHFDSFTASGHPMQLSYSENQVVATSDDTFNMDQSNDFPLVNEQDIDDFLLALINPEIYMDTHPLASSGGAFGDGDGDHVVDLDDVPLFEQALGSNGIHVSIMSLLGVPEPETWCILLTSILVVTLQRYR